ncbi:MAG: cyclic nucleotide-binding domain-containing protein [Desulfobacterales bacterium]|nr:cyclic nucleotide-binding domain-containing protein [Desulfobacterales bacterium]
MKTISLDGKMLQTIVAAMKRCEIFSGIKDFLLSNIASRAVLCQYDPDEIIIREKEPSDSFFLLIHGKVAVLHAVEEDKEPLELTRIDPPSIIGEISVLLDQPRTATLKSVDKTLILKFNSHLFIWMFENVPSFGICISRSLASRVQQLTTQLKSN